MPPTQAWNRLAWILIWTVGTKTFSASSAPAANPSATFSGLHHELGRQLQASAEAARGTSTPVFGGSITRAQICAFIPGYFAFLAETTVAVSSVAEFMPDMKVAIATSPSDFHVFTRLDSLTIGFGEILIPRCFGAKYTYFGA